MPIVRSDKTGVYDEYGRKYSSVRNYEASKQLGLTGPPPGQQAQPQAPVAEAPQGPPPGQEVVEAAQPLIAEYDAQQKIATIDAARKAAIDRERQKQTNELMGAQTGFQEAGLGSLEAQQALLGLLGPEAQQAAIAQLESSPMFQSMMAQGERAILQNAAATGGVRGGNTQAALAQFRPQLLSSLISQQYERLGGLTGLGAQVGQGLVGAGIQRETTSGQRADLASQARAELGLGGAATQTQAGLGQLQYDVNQAAIEEDKRRYEESIQQANADRGLGFVSNVFGFFSKFFPGPKPGV